jgi:hypothetical protein
MTLHDDNKLQRMEVLRIMADGEWHTLPQLSSALGNRYMVTSLSARLRDFRKEQYGSYRVERRLVVGSERLYEYRVLPPMGVGPRRAALTVKRADVPSNAVSAEMPTAPQTPMGKEYEKLWAWEAML